MTTSTSVAVLVYHRIIRSKNFREGLHIKQGEINPTVVSYNQFKEQMKYLYSHHYTTLSLKEFYNWLISGRQVPNKSVLITFDDGFKSVYANAYPILKKYQFRATDFIITSKLKPINQSYHPENGQYLSIKNIKASCDLINYQSHTYNDHYLNKYKMSSMITDSDSSVKKDLQTSIKNLNGHHLAFAYPYGQYDDMDIRIIKGLFNMAFTAPGSIKDNSKVTPSTNPYKIPRYSISSATTMPQFIDIIK